MRVKYVRKNANDLELTRAMLREYDYLYDPKSSEEDKDYGSKCPHLKLGYESNVYAISVRRDCTSYYIQEPGFDTITHLPSICFDIVDSRISKHWHIQNNLVPPRDGNFPRDAFERTVFAIEQWIREPRFLEFLVDEREREFAIMNKMIAIMDAEFT